MPNLDEILAQGSASFRRLNSGLGSVPPRAEKPAVAPRPLAAPAPLPQPQPDIRETLERIASAEKGRADRAGARPHVHFHLFRVRLLDGDNKFAAVKLLLDGLRYAGLITNDRECDIDLAVTQHPVPHYAREGTGVVITYR